MKNEWIVAGWWAHIARLLIFIAMLEAWIVFVRVKNGGGLKTIWAKAGFYFLAFGAFALNEILRVVAMGVSKDSAYWLAWYMAPYLGLLFYMLLFRRKAIRATRVAGDSTD